MNRIEMPLPNRKIFDLAAERTAGNVSALADIIGVKQQSLDRLFKIDKRSGKYPSVSPDIKKALKDKLGIDEIYLLTTGDITQSGNGNNANTGGGTINNTTNNYRGCGGADEKAAKDITALGDRVTALEDTASTLKTRPLVPYTVAAGSLTTAMEGIAEWQCERKPIIRELPAYDFTIIVKGDSMEPKFEGGDEIACRRIDETSFIQWGKPHVLDTVQGLILKRIYEDEDKIKCVSYNSAYPDFSIDKTEVYSISLVVGLIRI